MSGGFGRGQVLESNDFVGGQSFGRQSDEMVKEFENMYPSGQNQQFRRNQDGRGGEHDYDRYNPSGFGNRRSFNDKSFTREGRGGGGGGRGGWGDNGRGSSFHRFDAYDRPRNGGGRGEWNSFGDDGEKGFRFGDSSSGGSWNARGGFSSQKRGGSGSGDDSSVGKFGHDNSNQNDHFGSYRDNSGNDNRGFARSFLGGRGAFRGDRRDDEFRSNQNSGSGWAARGWSSGSFGDPGEKQGWGRFQSRPDDENERVDRHGGQLFNSRGSGPGGGGFRGSFRGGRGASGFGGSRSDRSGWLGGNGPDDEPFGLSDNRSNGFRSTFSGNQSNNYGTYERRRATSFIPEDRTLEEMYMEDAGNAKYEVSDLDLEVSVTGIPDTEASYRLRDWRESGFSDALLRNIIDKSCYKNLRRIQTVIIPLIKNGWDICGHAETGSGKTAAFILPIIDNVMRVESVSERCAPIALILAPTRELVAQLYNQTRKFVEGTGVTVAKAYGQYRIADNIVEIQRGCDILVATMGRLKDFIGRERIKLHHTKFFVLDEADRMLNGDSFIRDIMDLVERQDFPSVHERQTLLFSATFEPEVQQLAKRILKPQHAFVSNGRATAANAHVRQLFVQVSANRKLETLLSILTDEREEMGVIPRTLVFVERKKTADAVALYLSSTGLPCSSTNGDRDQKQREDALRDFRKGTIRVLVSTDVCARGIDVKDLEHVINYDLPKDMITYVHRIGRTGRLHSGRATTFIDIMGTEDRNLAPDIVRVVEEVQQVVPKFLRDLAEGRGGFSGINDRNSSRADFEQKEGVVNEIW